MRNLILIVAGISLLSPPAHAQTLSAAEQGMYWRSLSRMMESGRVGKEIHYRGETLTVSFTAGKLFEPQPGMLCRPFNQRITRKQPGPYQQGQACRGREAVWCRQMKGSGDWQCPPKTPSAVAGAFRDARIDWRNFKSNLANGYTSKIRRRLPF